MNQPVYHIPALLVPTLDALDIKPDGTYIDATFGGGGHSRAIMERLTDDGHLYSFDQDDDAVSHAPDDRRFTMIYGNFRYMANFMRYHGVEKGSVDGILADLGVSFHHFDDAERGFTFRSDCPLDMRMNRHASLSAPDILNSYSEERLADVLYLYGELRQARRMAAAIVKARASKAIVTADELRAAIAPHISPAREKKELAQVFQALRIEVNGELDALREFMQQCPVMLRPGGRLCIITYHSLEDRLVKNFMRAGNFNGEQVKDLFGRCDTPLRPLGSKPVVPDDDEIARNPRSRSAKLRIAAKL